MKGLFSIVTVALSLVVSLFNKPKSEKQKPQAFDSEAFPKCDDGTPIPIAFGQVKTKDFVVLYTGGFRTMPIKTKRSKKG